MRILVTGMVNSQAGVLPRPNYAIFSVCLVRCMRALGHQVDYRIISVGEDLSAYDVIFCGIFSPFSINAKHIYAVTDCLDRYWRTDEKQVFTIVDDWTLHQIDQNSRSTRRQLTRLTRPSVFDRRPGYSWATTEEGYAAIARVYERVTETGWPPMVIPILGWGNPKIVMRHIMAEAYWPMDPVSYMDRYFTIPALPEHRSRSWIFAVIQEHSDWLGSLKLGWPVQQFGGGMTKREGARLVPVDDVFQAYARAWGVLSPPYKKLNGSGWWRERMIQAAMAGCVLYSDPAEAPQLGDPYTHPVHEIEAMETAQLRELAVAQAEVLRKGCWDGSTFHGKMNAMLSAAAMGDARGGLTREGM